VLAVAISFRNTDDCSFATQRSFFPQIKSIVDLLKANTGAPLILGGVGFSIMPEAVLDYCGLDLGIRGEGERSLPLLLSRMAKGENFHDIPGLLYRVEGRLRSNPPQFLDLTKASTPRRSFIDNPRYFQEGGMGCLETKRGCAQGCIYCADPLSKGNTIRLRSPKSVADEVQALVDQGIDHIHTCDSEFNLPEEHAKEVCREIVSRRLGEKVKWYAYASPAPFSQELASLFKRAGGVGINFGADSACDRLLKTLGRDFSVEDLRRTARICRETGIVCMYDLLLGAPGETRESLGETIETLKDISPDRIGASLGVRIYDRTKLAEVVRREGPLRNNPNLHGITEGNDDFSAPIFYLSKYLGDDAAEYLSQLVGQDERFFLHTPQAGDKNYNYDDNTTLIEAIGKGYRGAFWDILRRLPQSRNCSEK
jgi:radical SAM superfamily enzyme YgiQ (UPF0313 family)